jgi:S1-C subfamily serine protease
VAVIAGVAFVAAIAGSRVTAALMARSASTASAQAPSSSAGTGDAALAPPSTDSTSGGQGSATSAQEVGVVDINTRLSYQSAAAAGTGMVLTSSGEVLTNNHVIDGATSITATVVSTGRTYTATIVGMDPTADVAVLQLVGASGLKTVSLGRSSSVGQGDAVTAVGNAGGVGGTPSVAQGTIEAVGQTITASDENGANAEQLTGLIETNVVLESGDSGGPLLNAASKVVGMDTAASAGNRFRANVRVSFAIPIDAALPVVRQIESGQPSSTVQIGSPGFLGVAIQPAAGGPGGSEAVVSSVVSGSPAQAVGLQAGDVITSIDGHAVDSPEALSTVLHTHHPGDSVRVAWTDQSGQSHTATPTLVSGPAD